jgi:hypothetical protein
MPENNYTDKEKLQYKSSRAVRTTMMAAIEAIEKEFEEELRDREFRERFYQVRDEILDVGNFQIEILEKIFRKVDVSSKYNTYTFYNKGNKNGN